MGLKSLNSDGLALTAVGRLSDRPSDVLPYVRRLVWKPSEITQPSDVQCFPVVIGGNCRTKWFSVHLDALIVNRYK